MKEKVILFDGTNCDAFHPRMEGTVPDMIIEDGALTLGSHGLVSYYEYGDAHLHVEFRVPYMPEYTGQDRGNSGVYVQGAYEIQILDSWGNEPRDNECGGIYETAAPLVNACLPPEEWQTYDIIIRSAKFNPDGTVKSKAVITVIHNGTVIHNNFELPSNTDGGIYEYVVEEGPLYLQYHSCPVSFRNIWVQPLD